MTSQGRRQNSSVDEKHKTRGKKSECTRGTGKEEIYLKKLDEVGAAQFSGCSVRLRGQTELNKVLTHTQRRREQSWCVTMERSVVCGKGQNLERSRRLGAAIAWARLGCSARTPD